MNFTVQNRVNFVIEQLEEACYLITILTTFGGSIWDLHNIHFNDKLIIPVIVDLKQIEADGFEPINMQFPFSLNVIFPNILLLLVNPENYL